MPGAGGQLPLLSRPHARAHHTHSRSHAHALPHTCSHTLTFMCTLTCIPELTHSVTHTHRHIRALTHSDTLSHSGIYTQARLLTYTPHSPGTQAHRHLVCQLNRCSSSHVPVRSTQPCCPPVLSGCSDAKADAISFYTSSLPPTLLPTPRPAGGWKPHSLLPTP